MVSGENTDSSRNTFVFDKKFGQGKFVHGQFRLQGQFTQHSHLEQQDRFAQHDEFSQSVLTARSIHVACLAHTSWSVIKHG